MNSKQESPRDLLNKILENGSSGQYQTTTDVLEFLKSLDEEIEDSVEYLNSDDAQVSVNLDPYWPKWHSPWWHMTALYELGLAKRIPYRGLELFIDGMDSYLHFFPFTEAEVPADRDPISDVLCLCALATAERVLRAADVDVDTRLPWLRDWFTKYQLPDGGYNCDESAYAKTGKSSMISTIHMMESMLDRLERGLLCASEIACLDESARYVIERRLMRSISKKFEIMDSLWCELTFPRFYEIDILRTLHCIVSWATLRGKKLPWLAIEETVQLLNAKMEATGVMRVERDFYTSCGTRLPLNDGTWLSKQPVSSFPLLLKASALGHEACPILSASWYATLAMLRNLEGRGFVEY